MTLKNAEKDIEQLTQQYCEFNEIEQSLLENYYSKDVNNWADVWEDSVSQYAKETVVIDIDENIQISYQELDNLANKVATWCDSQIREELALVGVYAPNSIAFLATVLGLYKIGKIAVLFNAQETHQGVSRIAKQYGIFDMMTHQVGNFQSPSITTHEISSVLQTDLSVRECSFQRSGISLDDTAMIIFTSGTSGFKKPALFSHKRMMTAGVKWSQRIGMKQKERCYIPLPLCHGNGLVLAFSSCVTAGATAVIRKRFSVKNFFSDIRQYGCSSCCGFTFLSTGQ
jgi:fatty-acyl-CoA synthase